ncbi:hypothetical protein EXN32_07935 [Agrobacterium tumefaciens]|uniref:hypothetical protein n=1 Tax=Agrobacterium TaxID=357 RepID=UPI00115CD34F|nr:MULTISPECIES: hypothetical protein [Agrobacterium]MDA5245336.1 hypothetical protein [Agrobacterium sp. MAFF310724]MDA5246235.1 hypothetical protein [Agrobacterium sp. MAFF210268]TRB17647.1 hypothetical protein EXN32_07935 [Agrobacterium tumefaciens]
MPNDVSEDEKWERARVRYQEFRENRDGGYLLQIVLSQFERERRVTQLFGKLANIIMAKQNEGQDISGLVGLKDFIDEPYDAEPHDFYEAALMYWDFECLAHDYQKDMRLPIYPDAILIQNPEHEEYVHTPNGIVSYRNDHADDPLGAVLKFLAQKFRNHPHMVELFTQFRKDGRIGFSVNDDPELYA